MSFHRSSEAGPGRGSALLRLLALSMLLLLVMSAGGAVAIPPGPLPIPDPEDLTWQPPAGGFDWFVPERFTETAGASYGSRFNWRYLEAQVRYEADYVEPHYWPVTLYGCRTQADAENAGSTTNTYTFVTTADVRVRGQQCIVQLPFHEEGSYEVRMAVHRPDGSLLGRWQKTVVVKDLLIVVVGDSYASGEGNPEYRRGPGQTYGDWVDDRCHRSSFAGSPRAAREIERSDWKTSVTFVSFACSGANIDRDYMHWDPEPFVPWDPYVPGSPAKNIGSGVLGPYQGAQPPNPSDYSDKIPSQIDQLRAGLGLAADPPRTDIRQIDALIMSAGGNDAGFGLLALACVVQDDCVNPDVLYTDVDGLRKVTLTQRVLSDLALMPARYDALAAALTADPRMVIAATYIMEYPDPGTEWRSDTNRIEECEEILEDINWLASMEINGRQWGGDRPWGSELGFARNVFLPRLNTIVQQAATRHGWQYVDGISAGFHGHGYCVGANDREEPARYVQTAAMSSVYQGPDSRRETKGTLHPNERGHRVYRDRILAHISAQLAAVPPDGNRSFPFDPTVPTVSTVVTPTATDAGWHSGPVTVTATGQGGGAAAASYIEHRVAGGNWQRSSGPEASVLLSGAGTQEVEFRAVDLLEGVSAHRSMTVQIDDEAPLAPEVSLGGLAGAAGWWRSAVTATLQAEDQGPAGVGHFEQRQGSGAWQPLPGDTATISGDGVHTWQFRAVDRAGTAGPATTATAWIDATGPTVACGQADGLWHPVDVEVACTASDASSGLADAADAAFTLGTAVSAGVETAYAATGTRTVCDVAGNCTSAGPVAGHRVDRRAPTITVTTPQQRAYGLGELVAAGYGCRDGGSGVASCAGTVPDGAPLDTSTIGEKTFSVTAVDIVGNAGAQSVLYDVDFVFGGFSRPVEAPPTVNTVKGGVVVPVRFTLDGDQGLDVLSPGAPRSQKVPCDASASVNTIAETVDTAGHTGLIYDSETATYVLLWKTERTWNGSCRQLDIGLIDGTTHSALFRFGK
jgi:hypothetical protein